MIVLTKLHLIPNDKDEKTLSGGLKKYLEKLDIVMLIAFHSKVLSIINPVSQLLQKEDRDVSNATTMLKRSISCCKLFVTHMKKLKKKLYLLLKSGVLVVIVNIVAEEFQELHAKYTRKQLTSD